LAASVRGGLGRDTGVLVGQSHSRVNDRILRSIADCAENLGRFKLAERKPREQEESTITLVLACHTFPQERSPKYEQSATIRLTPQAAELLYGATKINQGALLWVLHETPNALFLCCCAAIASLAAQQPLVVVSVDGWTTAIWPTPIRWFEDSEFSRLMREGQVSSGVIGVVPTVTWRRTRR